MMPFFQKWDKANSEQTFKSLKPMVISQNIIQLFWKKYWKVRN